MYKLFAFESRSLGGAVAAACLRVLGVVAVFSLLLVLLPILVYLIGNALGLGAQEWVPIAAAPIVNGVAFSVFGLISLFIPVGPPAIPHVAVVCWVLSVSLQFVGALAFLLVTAMFRFQSVLSAIRVVCERLDALNPRATFSASFLVFGLATGSMQAYTF